MARDEGFVGRWSRLKRAARDKHAEPSDDEPSGDEEALARTPPPPAAEPAAAPTGKARPPEPKPGAGAGAPPFDPASLPDLESLTYESDYSPFLQKGVPLELRNQALRRLWRSSPVLANLDGLVEYGEDYSGVGTKKTLVRTAYRVGRGMIDRALEETAQAPKAPPAPAGEGGAPPAQERIEASHEAQMAPARPGTEELEAEEPETAAPETEAREKREGEARPRTPRHARS